MARKTLYTTPPGSEGIRLLRGIEAPLTEIAYKTGIKSAGTVSDYRQNRKTPDASRREALQREYGIPVASWDDLPQGTQVSAPSSSDLQPTKQEVESQLIAVKLALNSPDTAGSPATRARLTSEMRALLKLRSHLESQETIDRDRLARSQVYQQVVAAIVAALAPFPEARDKVIECLASMQ